ncbi:MAG: hypothetical protein AAGD38_01435 [Acidobacteriota bacterium]
MRSVLSSLFIVLSAAVAAASTPTTEVEIASTSTSRFMRGMTVTCPRFGEIWGSPAFADSLRQLHDIGVDWVSIHPYAGIRRDGGMRIYPAAGTGYLDRAVDIARDADMALFWKPHLAYWGSFEWRGVIEFGDDETAWRRFFTDYEEFIVDQARFAEAADAPLFAVGVELEATTHRPEWRQILERVREVYRGDITYAANWDSLDKVPFWDAVDQIGVQAYFPLADDERPPSRQDLDQAWDLHLDVLRKLADKHAKPIVLTEIGYDLSLNAALEPWHTDRSASADERVVAFRDLLIHTAIERVEATPFITGMFWWKWMPGRIRAHRDFPMRHPAALAALDEAWGNDAPTRID